jgi:hypothetical protein
MTHAQLLQAQIMNDFWSQLANPLQYYNDKELGKIKQIAVETRNGRYIKAINNEMSRRIREE